MTKTYRKYTSVLCLALLYAACKVPKLEQAPINKAKVDSTIPASYNSLSGRQDTMNIAKMQWRQYFTDPDLQALIDTALLDNQELNIRLQEILVAQNEINARKGEYMPFVNLGAGLGAEHASKYTIGGATEDQVDIVDGKKNPYIMPEIDAGAYATWEVDIWHKLHNSTKAAVNEYLATVEGKNFLVTNLIAEIANSYYELLALDNQLEIVQQNIGILTNALEMMKVEKEATKVTELAVRKFQAEVLKTQSVQYGIQQKIVETENRVNFLVGRYPQKVKRNDSQFNDLLAPEVHAGLPSQLLENRPDIREAEDKLAATKLNVQVAKARFYPSLGISANLGYQAFNPTYLLRTPSSLFYSLAGDLSGPLVNRKAIEAAYSNANVEQIEAVYNYQRTILKAYAEVANQLSNIQNLEKSYTLKSKQVDALNQSIAISKDLFMNARADYMEVLMTQRDALDSKFELIETKEKQLNAMVNIYQALGGGWN